MASLLLIFLLQLVTSVSMKSPIMDEPLYLARGISVLKTGDFRLNFMQPPLAGVLGALPLLFIKDLRLPLDTEYWKNCKHQASYYNFTLFSNRFLWDYNKNVDLFVFLGRLPMMLLSMGLAVLVFKWAKELYGAQSGIFALFLYVFSPNILAHSRLITNDLCVSTFIFLTVYLFWRFCNKPTLKRLSLSGVSVGLSLLSKGSSLTIPILLIALGSVYAFFNQGFAETLPLPFKSKVPKRLQGFYAVPLSVFFIMLIAVFMLWGGYGFSLESHYTPQLRPHTDIDNLVKDYIAPKLPDKAAEIKKQLYSFMENTPLPLVTYIRGVIKQARIQKWGHTANFLMGEHRPMGWWYYFFFAFLVKTPIPALLFMLITPVITFVSKNSSHIKKVVRFDFSKAKNPCRGIDTFFVLAFPATLFFATTKISVNYGLKYLLPAYPFLFVYVSRLASIRITKKNKGMRNVFLLLCVWYAYSSISIYPNYLSYFNEFVGGPDNGYKYLVDANIDWGQDLKGLKQYMDKNKIKHIKLCYYGAVDPRYYKIDFEPLQGCKPTKGLIAISATRLQGLYSPTDKGLFTRLDCFNWLKQHEPIDKVGKSIFIYHIR